MAMYRLRYTRVINTFADIGVSYFSEESLVRFFATNDKEAQKFVRHKRARMRKNARPGVTYKDFRLEKP